MQLAQDRDQWWLVNVVTNLRVQYKVGNFLTSSVAVMQATSSSILLISPYININKNKVISVRQWNI